jgi:hypothetical protein
MTGLHLKRLHLDADSIIVWCGPKDNPYKPSLGIHIDFPWSADVRQYDCPQRINLHCWHWFVMIALNKESKSQAWSRQGTTERFRWITWHPNHYKLCCREPYLATKWGRTQEWECSRLKGHKGEHG